MRSTRARALLGLLIAVALMAAACGDDDNASSGSGGTLQFKALDAGGPLTKAALRNNDIQVALLFTSDADIAVEKWVLLDDDKKLQPAENLIPAIRKSADSAALEKALNAVSKPLTTVELTELNRQQSQDKQDSSKIAKAWLEKKKLVPYSGDKLTGSIKVGSTNFGEQEIVAEVYAQVLESAGMKVDRKFKLGNREVVAPALEKGDIDLYPEYVGSYTSFLDKNATVPTDVDKAVTQLRSLAAAKSVVLADAAPAEDKNGFVVTKATADKYKLKAVSDLKDVKDTLTFGGPPECPQRPYCAIGLQQTYGLTVKV
ncbi:MAG TPA: glycine betaine ABC transporter substrate-binding protein [Acidimicrobiales bacterium]|jgi:osmoprotectant transport system substrate-binding protein|nr:glycine betaine ABC transporter substrate-binding protein [Acidimicrobiales bacterium]